MKRKSKHKRSTHTSHRKTPAERSHGIFEASLFGVGIGGAFAVALLLIFSLICTFSQNPDKLISPLAFVASAISYFAAGFAASKKHSAPLPIGALTGGIMCLCFFVISLFLNKELSWDISLTVRLMIRLSFVAVCVFGALIGSNTKVKKRRKR